MSQERKHSGLATKEEYLMAVTTEDGAELRREHVHQVLQPEVLPQVLDVDLGPRLAHSLPLDALLCRLIGPDMANIRLAAPYDMLTSCLSSRPEYQTRC